jgi:hypothetical protein
MSICGDRAMLKHALFPLALATLLGAFVFEPSPGYGQDNGGRRDEPRKYQDWLREQRAKEPNVYRDYDRPARRNYYYDGRVHQDRSGPSGDTGRPNGKPARSDDCVEEMGCRRTGQ